MDIHDILNITQEGKFDIMYEKQIEVLINYFRNEEKKPEDYLLGIEIEHFLIHQHNLTAVSYFEDRGIENILEALQQKGWTAEKEEGHILSLHKKEMDITLEPGGQLEISIAPQKKVSRVDNIYQSFLKDLLPLLEEREIYLVNLGYQPVSLIEEIPLLPKKRYDFMYDYFKKQGKYAHNMMKGTAAVHVCYDFSSERDFIKKSRVASFLVPIIYAVLDNTPFFEGEINTTPAIRALVWSNCDDSRSGLLPDVFKDSYSYRRYAEYILNTSPVVWKQSGELKYISDRPIRDLMDPEKITREELEYILTMVFPEIRIKNCVEIRAADSLPYPYNIGYLALLQGLVYDSENLDRLYDTVLQYDPREVLQLRESILKQGLAARIAGQNIRDYFLQLVDYALHSVPRDSRDYVQKLKKMFTGGANPRQRTLSNLNENRKKALDWCLVNGEQGRAQFDF